MTRYSSTMTEALQEVREGFSPKQIKMAIGIAADKRYARGNYSGAVKQIEKIKKGLSDHPQVAAVLKRLNTDFDPEIQEEIEIDEKVKEYKGVAYFKTRKDAEAHMKKFAPKGRVVEYERGYAIQTKISGPYLNKAGKTEEVEIEIDEKFVDKDPQGKKFGWVIFNTKTNELIAKHDDKKTIEKMKQRYERMGEPVTMMTFSKAFQYNEEVELDEMKMDDPKLVKTFDKLKKGQTIKLKTSSTINQGKDFVEYIVKSKNTVNKGRVEKVTLVTKGNEKAVKKFLYKRDGKVTFAIGDMGASIDDIKEGTLDETKSATGYEIFHKDFSSAMQHATAFAKSKGQPIKKDEIDNKVATGPKKPSKGKENSYTLETEKGKRWSVQVYNMGNKFELNMYLTSSHVPEGDMLDEMREPYAVVDTADGDKVVGTASDEKGAKSIITTSQLPPMRIKDKKTLKIVKVKKKQMIGHPIKEEPEKKMDKPDSAKAVDQGRDDKKKTRIAQLQLQIAKAQETINKLNAQEKPNG